MDLIALLKPFFVSLIWIFVILGCRISHSWRNWTNIMLTSSCTPVTSMWTVLEKQLRNMWTWEHHTIISSGTEIHYCRKFKKVLTSCMLKNPKEKFASFCTFKFFRQMISLPKKTADGNIIHFYRFTDPDPRKLDHASSLKALTMFVDMELSSNGPADGYILVFDMKGISLSHIPRLQFSLVRFMSNYFQVCHW